MIKEQKNLESYKFPLSGREGYACYGLPCACLACRHEEGFCVDHDQDPCRICSGKLEEISTEFCIPEKR